MVLVIIVILIVVFFKQYRDNADNLTDIFGAEIHVEELDQIQDQYKLNSLQHFRSYNPSVFKLDGIDEPFYVFRMCNFALCPGKKLQWDPFNRERTESHSVIQSPTGELFIVTHTKLGRPKCEQGCEDARSFIHDNKLYLVCNASTGEECRREMIIMEIPVDEFITPQLRALTIADRAGPIVKDQVMETLNKHNRDIINDQFNKDKDDNKNNAEDEPIPIRKYIREVFPTNVSKLIINFDNHRDQKNWMPVIINNNIHFIYSVNPHVILKYSKFTDKYGHTVTECKKIAETKNKRLPEGLRGGSQAIRVTKWNKIFRMKADIRRFRHTSQHKYNTNLDPNDKNEYSREDLYIAVTHKREKTFQYMTYIYAFEVNYPYKVKYITNGFTFGENGSHSKRIQFASGLARVVEKNNIDGQDIAYLYITYGESDCSSKVCKIKEETVMRALIPIGKFKDVRVVNNTGEQDPDILK